MTINNLLELKLNDRITLESYNTLRTERFILNHLQHEDGTIRTNFSGQEEGSLVLSESLGLWMEYLTLKNDQEQFAQVVDVLTRHYLLKNHLIAWEIKENERSETNALIDDLRIINALFLMGKKTQNTSYTELATEISRAIVTYHEKEDILVDFYDTQFAEANDSLTLSYIIPEAIDQMSEHHLLTNEAMGNMQSILREMPMNNGFYPQSYEVHTREYTFTDEINLIDQLYIARHFEQMMNNSDDAFNKWLKEEFNKERKLFGRYDLSSKEPTVTYESVAVYALAILYSVERGDETFARDVYNQMQTLQINDEKSLYDGGYMDEQTTHSFDNLLALIAERTLKNEQIIQ